MPDLKRWTRLWNELGLDSPSYPGFENLLAAYNEPTRFYHTLQHLDACLEEFDHVRDLCEHPAEVELALWFHDIVYDSHRSDNEEKSAEWMERVAREADLSEEIITRVRDLILATRHNAPPESSDTALLVDIDLAVLGADEERFDRYEQDVRKEYDWVSDEQFREGRAKVLRSFLDRETIYSTELFRAQLEESARKNIERSLTRLEGRPTAEQ